MIPKPQHTAHQHGTPKPSSTAWIASLLLVLAIVFGACSVSGSANTASGGSQSGATATTDTSASLTPTVIATTPVTPTPTTSSGGGGPPPPPTSTPLPVLQGQLVLQSFGGAIHAGTNSSIIDVSCPAGYLVAGGGINSGYTKFTTMWNAPISTTKWRAEIFNNGSSDIFAQVQVMCLKAPGLAGQVVLQSFGGAIHAGTNSSIIDVSCPAGYLVAGGGINSGYTNFTTMWNAPISTTKFRAELFNNGSSDIFAQAQVMCLSVLGLQEQVVVQGFGAIGANTNSAILDVSCPAGYLVAGGGINSGYTNFTTMWNAPISTTKFRAELFNRSGSQIFAQTQVSCLKLG